MNMLDRVCRIIVYGDSSECIACGAKWDTNENERNEPPNCAFERMRQDMRAAIEHRPWWWRLIGRTHMKRD